MERRHAPRADGTKLDEHEDEILQLYKDKKLDEVVKEINAKYNIRASKTQFRKRVEKWHAKKYISRTDAHAWEQAGRELRDRTHDNKESTVIWNGRRVSDPAIQRRLHRYSAPRLADKFAIDCRGIMRRSPEPSHVVIVQSPPRESMALVPSSDIQHYFRGFYDGAWHSSYMTSIPIPPMLESLTQTLIFYRETCLRYLQDPVQTLLLSIPQQNSKDLMNGIEALLSKFTFTAVEAGYILQIMAFAIANNIEAADPNDEVLANLFHMVRYKTYWLKELFKSQSPVTKCLSDAFLDSAFRRLDMKMVESCLRLGADPIQVTGTYGSRYLQSQFEYLSTLVYSLLHEKLSVAKLLYEKGVSWTTSQSTIRKPIMALLSSSGGRWLIRDDVWDFVTSTYPGALREAREFIQEKPERPENWIVVHRLLPLFPSMGWPRPWQSAVLYSTLITKRPSSFPKLDDGVTLKDFEQTFKVSPITQAITTLGPTDLSEDQILHVVEKMLSLGADPNYQFEDPRVPVVISILYRYWSIVGLLLDHGGVAEKWKGGTAFRVSEIPKHIFERLYRTGTFTLSHAILSQEHPEFIQYMLTLNPSYQLGCPQGRTHDSPLTMILEYGSFEYLDPIFEAKTIMYDCQALMIAVLRMSAVGGCPGSLRLIEYLLDHRPAGTEICANEGTTLIFAICGGFGELVIRMSEVGVNLSVGLKTQRRKPLFSFLRFKTFEDFGRDELEFWPRLGRTCEGTTVQDGLDWLLIFASSEAVRSALAQRITPSGRHLRVAAASGRPDLFEILIEYGVSRRELDAQACLQHACKYGNLDMINKLLGLGVRLNDNITKENRGSCWYHRTVFQTAVERGDVSIVETLIEHGANVNEPAGNVRGATALQLTAGAGILALLRRLKDLGADINAAASPVHGRTALEAAAEQGRLTTVQFLLSSGVSTENQQRRQYIQAVKLAAFRSHSVIETVLRNHRQPWTEEDWRIYNDETLSDASYDPDDYQSEDYDFNITDGASTEDECNDGGLRDDWIESSDCDTGGQNRQLLSMDPAYLASVPDFMNNFGSNATDQVESLAHLDMIDWVDETTQNYDLYRSPGLDPELSIIPSFASGSHIEPIELRNQFHFDTGLGIDEESRQESASNLIISIPDLDADYGEDPSAVDTSAQDHYFSQPKPDISVSPSNIDASGSLSALDSCWLNPDAGYGEDPFTVDTMALYSCFSQPTLDIPMSLSNIAASGSGSVNNSRSRTCANVLEQCYCMNALYMDGADIDDELWQARQDDSW